MEDFLCRTQPITSQHNHRNAVRFYLQALRSLSKTYWQAEKLCSYDSSLRPYSSWSACILLVCKRSFTVYLWCILIPESLCRPVNDEGQRVLPCSLSDHRQTHDFKGTGCLCALDRQGIFTESAIYQAAQGHIYSGEYVAGCASNWCGYLGE